MRGLKLALLLGTAAIWAGGAAMAADVAATPAPAPESPGVDQRATEVDGLTIVGVRSGEPSSLKTDIPVLETPRAISVVTAETLSEQGITRLADALRNVAGVSRSSTYGYYDAFQIRGYDAAYGSIYLDGLTSGNVAGAVNELAGLEQVEVIKGPASALYGASPLGGVVNLVSKRPKAEPLLDVGVATGSHNLREVTVDANHALTQDGALLGRVNIVYRASDDFVDHAGSQRIYIAPALTWKIGADTSLTLLGRYQRDYDSPWGPVEAWGTVLPWAYGEFPTHQAIASRGDQKPVGNVNAKQIGYVFDHRFNDVVSFSQTLRYEDRHTFWDKWIFAGGFADNNIVNGVQYGHNLIRYVYGPFQEHDNDFAVDSRLKFDFATGTLRHKVLAGIDYRDTRETHSDGGSNFNAGPNDLDLLNPDYDKPLVYDPAGAYSGGGKSHQTGFYLHDHVSLTDRLTVTLGGRWDKTNADGKKDSKFSPNAGATWAFTPQIAGYASYAKSFTPTSAYQTAYDGSFLPPETGLNIEAGLKVQKADGTLSGAVAVYQLTRQNVATNDPDPTHVNFYVVTGEQRSRGVEIEGAWRPNAAIELTAAYSHINAKVTKDNTQPVGLPLPNFPGDSLNLWSKYTVQNGPLARLGFSLGLTYLSDRHIYEGYPPAGYTGDLLLTLKSYTLLNAGLSYGFNDWAAQLTIDNLTDKRFFPDACCMDRITPGEPRNWRLSLRRSF